MNSVYLQGTFYFEGPMEKCGLLIKLKKREVISAILKRFKNNSTVTFTVIAAIEYVIHSIVQNDPQSLCVTGYNKTDLWTFMFHVANDTCHRNGRLSPKIEIYGANHHRCGSHQRRFIYTHVGSEQQSYYITVYLHFLTVSVFINTLYIFWVVQI